MTMGRFILVGFAIVALFKLMFAVVSDETLSSLLGIVIFGGIAIGGLLLFRDVGRVMSALWRISGGRRR